MRTCARLDIAVVDVEQQINTALGRTVEARWFLILIFIFFAFKLYFRGCGRKLPLNNCCCKPLLVIFSLSLSICISLPF